MAHTDMAYVKKSDRNGLEQESGGQSGHWLPALRPETSHDSIDTTSLFKQSWNEQREPSNPFADTTVYTPEFQSAPQLAQTLPLDVHTNGDISEDIKSTGQLESIQPQQPPIRPSINETSWSSFGRVGLHQDDELMSDEDDERLDPAWGIKRSDSAQILGTITRSTTFPDYKPSDQPTESTTQSPAPTEPRAMLSQHRIVASEPIHYSPVETAFAQTSEIMTFPTNLSKSEQTPEPTPQSLDWMQENDGEAGQELDLSTLQDESLSEQDPSDARFEEGLPLVQNDDMAQSEPMEQDEPPADEDFGYFTQEQPEEASFFDEINSVEEDDLKALQVPELERKSTQMVMDSLHVSDQNRSDSPKIDIEQENGVVEDEASQDFLAAIGKPIDDESGKPETKEVEAMWEAALDDDEFLVEDADDLLPDSDPGSPSSFTASLQKPGIFAQVKGESAQTLLDTTSQNQQTPPRERRPEIGRQTSGNPYAPHQPSTADLTQFSPTTYGNVGLTRPGLAPMNSFQAHLQQTPAAATPVSRAESFVDQSKGGYKSPYDLPMEMNKPRKRAHVPQPIQTSKMAPPPPRSSSISDKPLQSPFTPTNPNLPTATRTFSPPAARAVPTRSISAAVQPPASARATAAPTKFFEELPITSKARPATSQGRYTPLQPTNIPPPQLPPQQLPSQQLPMQQPVLPRNSPPVPQPSPPRPADPYAQYQLRPPERVDPFSNIPLQTPSATAAGPASTRYSPAPPAVLNGPKPSPSPRYSPAPPPQPAAAPSSNRYVAPGQSAVVAQQVPPPLNRYASQPQVPSAPAATLPFQPRTSSPLAHHGRSLDASSNATQTFPPLSKRSHSSSYDLHQQQPLSAAMPPPPPPSNYQRPGPKISPTKSTIIEDVIEPPRRTQTQSPSRQRPRPMVPALADDALNRPASVHGQPPNRSFTQIASVPGPSLYSAPRPQPVSEELEFIQPNDETQYDPLQRWKGAPVFKFGFGGTVISTFPKHVPRYSVGHPRPQIKATVGEVSTRLVKDVMPIADDLVTFPGPLRTKSKKKELLSWLSTYITKLESNTSQLGNAQLQNSEEKLILWKIMRSLVENDGVLDANQEALRSVNGILTPEIYALDEAAASQYRTDASLSGIYRPSGTNVNREPVDPMAIETLRKHLLKGKRQDAVWHAVDCGLWSHAFLISSTLDRSVWKQVVQEFVKQEVKTAGNNTEPLSALYEIFGGNLEESIDQLVPPSARAGLQMVSKAESSGPTKNALEGLNRWKETLSLVINNRSQGDYQAMAVLGRLLSDYGRIEASHICYLFSRGPGQPSVFGGADDAQTGIVFLGADHRSSQSDFSRNQEAMILTEIYEFATLILASGSTTTFMPHLSVYKLQKASVLADAGYKAEAQAYCDALAATLKTSTKAMPYYHPILLGELEELSNRLKQVPIQNSGTWTKPSLEKVSGSVWNKFSSFVAGGDDSDADSKGSAKDAAEAGPFAKVTGTPSISRSGSQSDLYGSYPAAAPPVIPATIAASRYAPNGLSSARSSSEYTRGRPSLDSQRSPPQSSGRNGRATAYEPISMFQQAGAPQQANPYQPTEMSPPINKYHVTPPQTSYMPNNILQESPMLDMKPPTVQNAYMPTPPLEQSVQRSYEPSPVAESVEQTPTAGPMYGDDAPQFQSQFDHTQPTDMQPSSHEGYNPSTQPYEPPSQSYGYEPPGSDTGYVPYAPEPESPDEQRNDKPKKKSILDDDDDFPQTSRASASISPSRSIGKSTDDDEAARKRANDAAAEAAFRAAAEEDANRSKDKTLKPKASWFGGWLGGKKEEGLDTAPSKNTDPNKVHRVHLGEKKMKLYYDEKLKKWVNPDNPDAALKSSTPPPPPRASGTPGPPSGPPRSTPTPSGMASSPNTSNLGPPSGPPSRAATPASGFGEPLRPGPPSAGSLAPPSAAANSRPGTAMSNASSIDDLIGPATGKKSVRGKKGAKAGRYVDVMAK